MAFSIRKMLSNINYFKKPGEVGSSNDNDLLTANKPQCSTSSDVTSININLDRTEPDSTSKHCATSLKLPDSMKNFAAKKGSFSDTDILTISLETPNTMKLRRKCRKLKLDIQKANKSLSESLNLSQNDDSSNNVENTPKHILLDCKSSELFSQRFKGFDFNKSFDLFDALSDEEDSSREDVDIQSLSDSDISIVSNEEDPPIKMCRKVYPESGSSVEENQLVPAASVESFGDVEVDKNEEERITLLVNYHMRLEKLDCFLKKLLSEFQFHIEISKIFNCKSIVSTLPGTDVSNIPKSLGEVKMIDKVKRGQSPTESWNLVIEKEDNQTKIKIKEQLLSMKQGIDEFVNSHLTDKSKKVLSNSCRSVTFDVHKGKRVPLKRLRVSHKKKIKHFDFPDLRDAMMNLFNLDSNSKNINEEDVTDKCICHCQYHRSSSESDSGLTTKDDRSLSSQSITSSIGNFSLDTSTLTAYSESLDQIISYNSFQDTSLYNTLLQKAAIERITFYVQVHSIQLKCEPTDLEYESKNLITFHCPACKTTEDEENGLLRHILSQVHCEKIHFLYKTAYIKKCVASGKEILPSTVLNPMKLYRDDNKIVCFGDAVYACSLCFENMIIGESVLMAHCSLIDHVEKRDKLFEIVE